MQQTTSVKLAMAAQMGRLMGHVLSERVRPRRPTTLDDVPQSVEHLTPEWLSAALCREHPDAQVVDFTLGDGSDGSTSRGAVRVAYNEPGQRAGLPTVVFTKATPKLTSRLITVPSGALVTEAAFYNTIQHDLKIETPLGYYAAVDVPAGGHLQDTGRDVR